MTSSAFKEMIGLFRTSPEERLAEMRQRQCGTLLLNSLLFDLNQALQGSLVEYSNPRVVTLDFTIAPRVIASMRPLLDRLKESGVESGIASDGRVCINKTQLAEKLTRFYFTDGMATAEECAMAFPHGLRVREALRGIISLLSCTRRIG